MIAPGAVFGEAAEERRVDPFELDDDGQVVGRLDRVDVVEHLEIDGAGVFVLAALERIFHVRRRSSACRRGTSRPAAGGTCRSSPSALCSKLFGEARDHIEILVHRDDRVVDVLQQPQRRGGAGLMDVEVLGGFGMAPDQRAALLRRVVGERRWMDLEPPPNAAPPMSVAVVFRKSLRFMECSSSQLNSSGGEDVRRPSTLRSRPSAGESLGRKAGPPARRRQARARARGRNSGACPRRTAVPKATRRAELCASVLSPSASPVVSLHAAEHGEATARGVLEESRAQMQAGMAGEIARHQHRPRHERTDQERRPRRTFCRARA